MAADVTTPLPDQEAFARSLTTDLAVLADVAEELLQNHSALDDDRQFLRSGLIEVEPTEHALTAAYLLGYQAQVLLRFGIEHLVGVIYTLPSLRPLVPQPSARAAGEAFAGLFELVDPAAEPLELVRRSLNRRIVSLGEQFNALGQREFIEETATLHEIARDLGMTEVPDSPELKRRQPATIGRKSTSGALIERACGSISASLGSLARISYQRTSATVHSQDHGINESSHTEFNGEQRRLPLTQVCPSRLAMVSDTFMPAVTAYGALLPFCDRYRLGIAVRGRLVDAIEPILEKVRGEGYFDDTEGGDSEPDC